MTCKEFWRMTTLGASKLSDAELVSLFRHYSECTGCQTRTKLYAAAAGQDGGKTVEELMPRAEKMVRDPELRPLIKAASEKLP